MRTDGGKIGSDLDETFNLTIDRCFTPVRGRLHQVINMFLPLRNPGSYEIQGLCEV